MKCDEVRTLHGPYLDSELDARTNLEIEQHLAACPACARWFAEEEKLETQLMAGLNQGPRTAALWEQIESAVGKDLTQRRREAQKGAESSFSLRFSAFPCVSALTPVWLRLRAGWQASRWAWSGLAAAWVVILALNFSAREPEAPLVAGTALPSASQIRFALEQKQLLLAELALTPEPVPANKPKPARPGPHSERHSETLNA